MKKSAWMPGIFPGIMICACVFYFSSCTKQGSGSEQTLQTQKTETQKKTESNSTDLLSARGCGIRICLVDFIRGHRRTGSFDCTGGGICFITGTQCFPEFVLCPEFRIPPCALVDCNNPWNYKDIFVNPVIRYRDLFQGDPNPEPSLEFVPLKVTPTIAVLQFYSEVKETLDQKTLKLPAAFNLPNDLAQSIGLKGNKIPAGTYPVIFDAQSKTFNAVVKVQ
jgi:hypothetical protein